MRKRFGVPGIISPSVEKTQSNAAFVAMLGIATDLPIAVTVSQKKGAVRSLSETPANLWALRLYNYLEGVRARFARGSDEQQKIVESWAAFNSWTPPAWLEAQVPFVKIRLFLT